MSLGVPADRVPARTAAFTFYLGTHQPSWLTRLDLHLHLPPTPSWLPQAAGRPHAWALDSGAFSELAQYAVGP